VYNRLTLMQSIAQLSTARTQTPTPTPTSSLTSARGSSRGSRRVRRARKSGRLPRRARQPRRARPVQLATSRTRTTILADLSAEFCPTRALFLARMSVGDARVYTCRPTCTVHDKLSWTRLQNYTIDAALMSMSMSVSVSVSVSFPWGSCLA